MVLKRPDEVGQEAVRGRRVRLLFFIVRPILLLRAKLQLVYAVLFSVVFLMVEIGHVRLTGTAKALWDAVLLLSALPLLRLLSGHLGEVWEDVTGEPLGRTRGERLTLRVAIALVVGIGVAGILVGGWGGGVVFGALLTIFMLGFFVTLAVGPFIGLFRASEAEMRRYQAKYGRHPVSRSLGGEERGEA